jgi:hypothetical protein
MCLIHIDESATRVDYCTFVTSSVYLFSEMLNCLFDRLDNRCTMHDFQSDALKWVHGSQKYTHYYSSVMLHGI